MFLGFFSKGGGCRGRAMTKILIVEDHIDIRKLLKMTLEFDDFEIHEAATGDAGWLLASELQPDIVLLDISMPGLDGPAALQLIRAKAEAQGARVPPAIAITSNAMTHQIADYMAAGFAAHLGKPFRKDDLIRVLGSHAPRRAASPVGVPA